MTKKTEKKETAEMTDIQVNPQPQTSVESLILHAIKEKLPVETMERFLALRREARAEWSKTEYDTAMADFQSECPIIKKDKEGGKTKSGIVAYRYAPLDSIVFQTKDLIKKHGFSYAIKTKTDKDTVSATCIVRHVAGHSEESTMEVPPGANTGIMSASQVIAAALTFAKRYAFCNAFGILTGDADTDGQVIDATKPQETKDQIFERAHKMISSSKDTDGLMAYAEKLEKSGFTKDQKESLKSLINNRIDILNNSK
jgi:hypothetical protein